jgi:Uma2 family endonuclease
MAAIAPSQTMTAEELLALPTGMGRRYELVQGELKTMSPAGSRHGQIALRLGALLQQFVRSHGMGAVVGAETGFILRRNPDTVRAPDAAFIAQARIPSGGLPAEYFPGAPDLAIEVVSPSDGAAEIEHKVNEYLAAGTQQVWLVYPEDRTVYVCGTQEKALRLTVASHLDGGTVLPGFTCPVSELFE